MSSGRPVPESVATPKYWGVRDRIVECLKTRTFRFGAPALIGALVVFTLVKLNHKQLGISDPWRDSTGTMTSVKREAEAERASRDELRLTAITNEARACRARIDEALAAPALPGAPELEARRARLLARAKAEPVLFLDVPKYTGDVSPGTAARRHALLTTEYPRDLFVKTVATFRDFPERLRDLVLRDGYIYTDAPRAGQVLIRDLKLDLLFHESKIMVQRGALTYSAEKGEDGLFYVTSGPDEGKRARLLLFDRVWLPGQQLGPAVHVDVREFARREGVDGIKVVRLTENAIVAELRFEDSWVPALIERDDVHLKLGCLAVDPSLASEFGRVRDRAYRRNLVIKALRMAIAEQVELGLPFDEPKTERGQQDGKLRERWETAYFGGQKAYKFNGDVYPVYSQVGSPMTPQVCIDFVTETLERASGMHFAPQGEPPKKIGGAIDFDELLGTGRRQELAMRNYARQNPDKLSMIDYRVSEWVPYEKVDKFFNFVEKHRDDMHPGDIVIIRGRAAWDRYEEMHTHTFFIFESDPITGMPMLLAGNAGKPRIVTWDSEMIRAPKRSIRHRIRLNTEWLYDQIVIKHPSDGERWAASLTVAEDRE